LIDDLAHYIILIGKKTNEIDYYYCAVLETILDFPTNKQQNITCCSTEYLSKNDWSYAASSNWLAFFVEFLNNSSNVSVDGEFLKIIIFVN